MQETRPNSETSILTKECCTQVAANKSLKKYVEGCILQLDYEDFCPPVNNHHLASKFSGIFYKENAYWEKYIPEDKWPRWVFIQFKSFKNSSRQIFGLNFSNSEITFFLASTISHQAIGEQNQIGKIALIDAWLDHSKLFQVMLPIIEEGVTKSNV